MYLCNAKRLEELRDGADMGRSLPPVQRNRGGKKSRNAGLARQHFDNLISDAAENLIAGKPWNAVRK